MTMQCQVAYAKAGPRREEGKQSPETLFRRKNPAGRHAMKQVLCVHRAGQGERDARDVGGVR